MCDEADVILTFLSLYFCDFNSIEIFFAVLKQWIKKNKQMNQNYKNFEEFLKETIKA